MKEVVKVCRQSKVFSAFFSRKLDRSWQKACLRVMIYYVGYKNITTQMWFINYHMTASSFGSIQYDLL